MAVIRTYPVGEAQSRPAPDVAFQPVAVPAAGDLNSFGGNQARDLQVASGYMEKASDSLGNMALREAEYANDARVQDLVNGFIDQQQKTLYTSPDAFYRKRGQDAINGAQAATEQLLELKKGLLGQAANDWQRRKLDRMLTGQINEANNGISRYVAAQSLEWQKSVAEGRQQLARNQAVLDYNDTDKIEALAASNEATAREAALRLGSSVEEATAKGVAARSDVITASITARLQNDQKRSALAMYDKYKDKLDEKDSLRLASAIKSTRTDVQADDWIANSAPNQTRQEVRRFFEAKGYSPEASAALAAHFWEESRFNPGAVNPKDGRDGSDSVGIGQWNGSRSKDLLRFAKENNLDPRERSTQLQFAAWELENTEGAAGKALKGAKSIEEANRAALGYFRPAVWNTNKDARLDLSRAAFADTGVGSDKLNSQGLINAAMNDPSISLETKTAVVTKLQRQSAQLEAARTAALKGLDDQFEAVTQMALAMPSLYQKDTLSKIADGYEAAGDRSKAVNARMLASIEGTLLNFSTSPKEAQDAVKALLSGKAKELAGAFGSATSQEASEATKAARDGFALIKTAAENNIPLAKQQDKIKEIVNLALKGRDRVLAGEITDWVNGRAAAEALGQAPQAAMTQLIGDLQARVAAGDQAASTVIQLDQLNKIQQQQQTALKADAYGAGTSIYTDVGVPVPINWNDTPDNIGASIGVRAAQARQITQRGGVPAIPFSVPEINAIRTKLDESDPQMQGKIIRVLATAPADMLPGIALALAGQKGEGDAVSRSYAAALAFAADKDPTSQAAADQILRGAQILKADGAGGRKPATTSDAWLQAYQDRLGPALMDVSPAQRQIVSDAVAAAYVYQMNRSGKPGEKLDQDVLNNAIKTVMGDAVSVNGQPLFPPQRGMTTYQFEEGVLRKLTDGDLGGARSIEGDPVTADLIRRRGVFTNVGDGTYKVRIPDPRRNGDLADVILGDGRPFLLDGKAMLRRPSPPGPMPPKTPDDARRRAPASPTEGVAP